MKKKPENKGVREADIIRQAGLRATKPRIALLSLLQKSAYPLNIKEIGEKLRSAADQVTLYRILDAFKNAGIVNRIDFQDRSARYEYKNKERDHHHVICVICKKIDDFVGCDYEKTAGEVLKQTPRFAEITGHSFEFFGKCRACIN